MESSLLTRYSDSQDHMIITLNSQIETLLPLKDSYCSLQRYYMRLSSDLEGLLTENRQYGEVYERKLSELLAANAELDHKKAGFVQELRNLENDRAKLTLQRKNLTAAHETLTSKFNLENQQSVVLQGRSRQIMESIKRTEQSMELMRKSIAELESEIKLKAFENTEIQAEIGRKRQLNKRHHTNSQKQQQSLKDTGNHNEILASKIMGLERKISGADSKIRDELKLGKQLNEKCLMAREELSNLSHQNEYYSRLIESEELVREDLAISEDKLKGLIDRRAYELTKIQEENEGLKQKMEKGALSKTNSLQHKDRLTEHLAELIRTNTLLLEDMQKCCNQDKGVHKILDSKFGRLEDACHKARIPVYEGTNNRSRVLKDIGNQSRTDKPCSTAEKSGNTWIGQLSSL